MRLDELQKRDATDGNLANRARMYEALDKVVAHCKSDGDKAWKLEFKRRSNTTPTRIPADKMIMERFCIAIAYSQGAQSKSIGGLIGSSAFKEAFLEFDHHALALANPDAILKRHWDALKLMRFRSKVEKIVQCARILVEIAEDHGSFARFLARFRIPKKVDSPEQFECFWKGFDSLRKDLEKRAMPFFRHTTSLLQLLLDLDHDAIKPDLIVMRLCRRLGIASKEIGDKHFRHAVGFMQEYTIQRKMSARALDWALLAFGGQTGAGTLLRSKYCPPQQTCSHDACNVGQAGLCLDYRVNLSQ